MDNLKSLLQLFVSGKNLPSMDLLSKSDPTLKVYAQEKKTQEYRLVYTSEHLKNDENPEFKGFEVEYWFEENQNMRFELVDEDDASGDDLIGRIDLTLAEIVCAPGSIYKGKIKDKKGKNKKKGEIFIRSEELSNSTDVCHLELSCKDLTKMDLFGKSDPYLVFYRNTEDNKWIKVHTTEIIKKTLNPRFALCKISMRDLCNADPIRGIKVECYDWDKGSADDLIGEAQFCVADVEGKAQSFELIDHEKKKKKKKYKNSGFFTVCAKVVKNYSFLDYIQGGMGISLACAIDFTGSNGDPKSTTSLHYMGGNAPNQYIQAINTCGSVLQPYDSDGKILALGYGAKVGNKVSHCFPLSLSNELEVAGVEGLIEAYANAVPNVVLSGPTFFSEVLNTCNGIAKSYGNNDYLVLMIITDGIINDLQRTINSLVDSTSLPMSVVIIGVGNANFDNMEALDGDKNPLSNAKGQKGKRDIVQFVQYKDFKNSHISHLAKEVLKEVPGQVLSYMKMKGIKPTKSAPPQF